VATVSTPFRASLDAGGAARFDPRAITRSATVDE